MDPTVKPLFSHFAILFDDGMPTYAIVVKQQEGRWSLGGDLPSSLDFEVYESNKLGADGPYFTKKGAHSSMDVTYDLALAESCCEGSVRWDGCVNYSVGEQEGLMMHACSAKELANLFRAIERAYVICAEAMHVT